MKKAIFGLFLLVLVTSCGTRVPYTDALKDQYDLSPEKLIGVQFYTSSVIILEKNKVSGNQTTGNDGALVTNTSKTQDRIIIPANTKCIFEKQPDSTTIVIRFEIGAAKTLKFSTRPTQTNGKYYLSADWKQSGGTLEYGNETYNVANGGSSAYLMVIQKKLQRVKRKDRIVRGMKV